MTDNLIPLLRDILDIKSDVEITEDSLLIEDLGADSLNVVEIVMEVETEFDIEIDDQEIDDIKTVAQLRKLISDLA